MMKEVGIDERPRTFSIHWRKRSLLLLLLDCREPGVLLLLIGTACRQHDEEPTPRWSCSCSCSCSYSSRSSIRSIWSTRDHEHYPLGITKRSASWNLDKWWHSRIVYTSSQRKASGRGLWNSGSRSLDDVMVMVMKVVIPSFTRGWKTLLGGVVGSGGSVYSACGRWRGSKIENGILTRIFKLKLLKCNS